jgi:predicted cupin superfamily sugar epimerase
MDINMNEKALYYIEKLKLIKHPEGGYFSELYRSDEIFRASVLPERYIGDRAFSTSIYFLLEGKQFSAFHKLQSDEIWHFYDGSPIRIYTITPEQKLEEKILGYDIEKNETLQSVIYKNSWFAAELVDKTSFGLMGCTVSPGFDFRDLEIGKRDYLLEKYPAYKNLIIRLTNV